MGFWVHGTRAGKEPLKTRTAVQWKRFRVGENLETFEALRCLIRKVDKRTLNARSAFHTTAGKPAETPFWIEADPGFAGTRYRSISSCCSPAYSWARELDPADRVTRG